MKQFKHTHPIGFLLVLATVAAVLPSCTSVVDLPSTVSQDGFAKKLTLSIGEFKSSGNRFALCSDCLAPTPKTLSSPPEPMPVQQASIRAAGDGLVVPVAAPEVVNTTGLMLKVESALKAEIYFVYNSSLIGPAGRQTLDTLAKGVTANDDLIVIGSADAEGAVTGNRRLAQQRATAVRDYLIARGVKPQRIESKADHLAFVADNSTAAGRAKNRRAEVLVASAPQ